MKADEDFINLINELERTLVSYHRSSDPIIQTMLNLTRKLKMCVLENTLNKNVTTLSVVRYIGEYDLPEDIVSCVERIDGYYHSIYKNMDERTGKEGLQR